MAKIVAMAQPLRAGLGVAMNEIISDLG